MRFSTVWVPDIRSGLLTWHGTVALFDQRARRKRLGPVPVGSDGLADFVERRCDAEVRVGFDTEFVVAPSNVLHERVTADDHPGGAVGL